MSFLDGWEDADPDGCRYYQSEACDSVWRSWETDHSTLVVMATGLGKTHIFSVIAKRAPGSVLVLAHRDELVDQAARKLEAMTGEYVEIEQGQLMCSPKTRLVVGSLSTISRQSRLDRLGRERFQYIIFDEAHHAPAVTYRRPLEYFRDAKQVGFTATPDRADEKALGQLFDSVSYCMDITDGIEAGYLVPVRGKQVELKEINLEQVKASRGDLAVGQLDEAMVQAVEGIVIKSLELEPGKPSIAFWPGVKSAEYAVQKFNALQPNSACFIHAGTDPDERKQIVRDFKAGRYRILNNVGIATEGFDAPHVSVIIQGRPTKSRALYAQMIGRATRVLPGTVDFLEGRSEALARRSAVASSTKPSCMVLDFVGNSGKHNLMTPVDALGGNYSEDEIALAKKKAKAAPGADARAMLAAARAELAELARITKAKVTSEVREFDPFQTLHIDTEDDERYVTRFGQKPATGAQLHALREAGVDEPQLHGLSRGAASKLIGAIKVRESKGLARPRQLFHLQRFGVTDINLSRESAARGMEYLISCDFGKRQKVDQAHLVNLIRRPREVGEEG